MRDFIKNFALGFIGFFLLFGGLAAIGTGVFAAFIHFGPLVGVAALAAGTAAVLGFLYAADQD